MTKHTLLCVDDEIDNVDALERLFRKKFTVLKATSGKEALEVLAKYPGPVSLIITDQRMPEMTGAEFLEQTLDSHPETIRILLTGYTDLESVIMAVNKGQIFRYLTKPWDPVDLSNTVDHAIERYAIGQELKKKNHELARALDELKSLDVAKSNFMILINHELKTPLTSILSFASLLKESKLSDEDLLMINRINKSAERLKSLIDDVLLIVRAETDQLKIDLQAVALNALDQEIPGEVQRLAANKGLTFKTQYTDQPAAADNRLVKQVTTRLLHNAIKFADSNSVIEVETKVAANKIRVTIKNKGPQIPIKVIQKITQPFFIDEDVMHHSTGTGLGLSICQAILKTHSASLDFLNTEEGVCVGFDLPIASADLPTTGR